VIVWRRQNRHKRPSRAAASGARPAIVVETATSPRRRSTGARSPARIARAAATQNGAASPTSRRTRRLPVNNLLQDPRHRNRRTPRQSTAEWSYPTACLVVAGRGTWRRAARPAPATSTGGSVPCRTASTASGRTAAGTAKMKGRATLLKRIGRASRRRSRPQSLLSTTS